MISERMERLIREIPKGENHIHIEGSIPVATALRLAKRNGVALPFSTEEEWPGFALKMISSLEGFMGCDRLVNSVCRNEEDYYEVIYDLGRQAKQQNIIYQEFHLDYPLNEVRGIPMEVVMKGYDAGRKAVLRDFGVDIVYIAGIDRSLPVEQCNAFVKNLENYLDVVDAVGMDCEERNYPCRLFKDAYEMASQMGLFLTAHAGEEGGDMDLENIRDALHVLKCRRIDHGVRAIDDPELVKELADRDILLAMCTVSNRRLFPTPHDHSINALIAAGVPCSISSDDPPYCGDLLVEYRNVVENLGFDEDKLIAVARNAFKYSIKGQKYLPVFDKWVENWKANG